MEQVSRLKPEIVGHIPKEISRVVYFFIKEGGKVDGDVLSVKYRPSPIPSGGLEIPLMLSFHHPVQKVVDKIQQLMKSNYSWTAGEDEVEEVTVQVAPEETPEHVDEDVETPEVEDVDVCIEILSSGDEC